jgi:hypothetical protein
VLGYLMSEIPVLMRIDTVEAGSSNRDGDAVGVDRASMSGAVDP